MECGVPEVIGDYSLKIGISVPERDGEIVKGHQHER
jgi:hypothetical protein